MEKVREYRQRGHECRELSAKATTPDLKDHYQGMARVWDKLAEERLTFFVAPAEASNVAGDYCHLRAGETAPTSARITIGRHPGNRR